MLEHLFGSRTRLKLLSLFLGHPEKQYYVREITRIIKEHINSVRRELQHLEDMLFVTSQQRDKKKYYVVNKECRLYPELKALLYKDRMTGEKQLVESIQGLGKVYYLALSGVFVEDAESKTDLFIVGKVHRDKLKQLLNTLQLGFDREIYYTILSLDEFHYRKEIADTFVADILNRKKVVVLDRIGSAA